MRIGLFGGTGHATIDRIVDAARGAAHDGFASFWLPQVFGLDAMGMLAIVGREVPRIELGTAVVPTYPRHPATMAQQALTVQAASGNRFALGIGLSHQIVIENMFGFSFEKPVRHMREYLSFLMPLLHERSAQFDGDTVSFHGSLDVGDVAAPPVLVAALGTQMLELTGRVADGTVTWMTGPSTITNHIVPTITKAASGAGRPAPRIGASLPFCVTADPDGARARAARDFTVYGMLPSYRAMLDREGAEGPADVAIVGDEAACRAAVDRMRDAGVTDFVANIFGERDDRDRSRALLKSLL